VNDRELDGLIRELSPVDDERVAALDLQRADIELMEDIVSSPSNEIVDIETERVRRSRRRRLLTRGVGGASAVAAVGALVVALLVGGGTSRPEFAEAAVKVAEANSRLLIGEPGWRVVRAGEFTVDDGELTFGSDADAVDGKGELELHWYPARIYRAHVRDRAADATRTPVTVLGKPATRFGYPALGLTELVTVLPPDGDNFVEIRGDVGGAARYMELLASLEAVDVDTWLAALPTSTTVRPRPDRRAGVADVSTVQPGERPAVVDEMLAGVPIPAGLDVDALRDDPAVMNRYDLGSLVAGAIACGWLDRWTAGRAAGDAAAVREAAAALRTSRGWPALREMPERTFNSVVWDYADAVEHPSAAKARNVSLRFYESGLGCPHARSVAGPR
jgi:hypothetical protein